MSPTPGILKNSYSTVDRKQQPGNGRYGRPTLYHRKQIVRQVQRQASASQAALRRHCAALTYSNGLI